ncbi:hypothetical protein [Paenibacillus wenxiniae]|uniref:Uncharacterized protein n=1 Tax=Paenibacillus wenxiniae TaxID=1636843 RepID=A0ABW4RCS7_9BACL
MSNQDKPNGKITKVEMQMQIDAIESVWPEQMQFLNLQCRYRKEKYDRLVEAGFSSQQALDIVKSTQPFD